MIYFETDISKGKHTIEVYYRAKKWIDTWDWVNQYSFRYALSPAKYWKSFGTLHVEIKGADFRKELSTNIGEPKSGSFRSIAKWEFNKLPTEILQINYKPKMSIVAQKLISTGPDGLAYITGFILVVFHLFFLLLYRRKNPLKRSSLELTIACFLLPLVFVICWYNYYDLIDMVIGEHASRRHGYNFFVFVLYLIITPFYWFIFWAIDKQIKKRNISKHTKEQMQNF